MRNANAISDFLYATQVEAHCETEEYFPAPLPSGGGHIGAGPREKAPGRRRRSRR